MGYPRSHPGRFQPSTNSDKLSGSSYSILLDGLAPRPTPVAQAADGYRRESKSIELLQGGAGSCVTAQSWLYRWGSNRKEHARCVSTRSVLTNAGFSGETEGRSRRFPDREQNWLSPCSDYSSGRTSRGFPAHLDHRGECARRAWLAPSRAVPSDNTHTGSRRADAPDAPSPPRTTHSLVGFSVSRLTT